MILKFFIASIVVATLSGLMSVYIAFNRKANLSHSISHLSLTSYAISYLLGSTGILGECIMNFIWCCLLNIRNKDIYNKSSLLISNVVILQSIGLFIFSYLNDFSISYGSLLYGSFWLLSSFQIAIFSLIAVILLAFTLLYGSTFIIFSIDESAFSYFRTVPMRSLNTVYNFLMGFTITMLYRSIGVFMVSALLSLPGMIAVNITGDINRCFVISTFSVFFSVFSSVLLNIYFPNVIPLGLNSFIILSLSAMYFISMVYRQSFGE